MAFCALMGIGTVLFGYLWLSECQRRKMHERDSAFWRRQFQQESEHAHRIVMQFLGAE
jgi:hypothetical protein